MSHHVLVKPDAGGDATPSVQQYPYLLTYYPTVHDKLPGRVPG